MSFVFRGNQAVILAVLFFTTAWLYGFMYYFDMNTPAIGLNDKDAVLSSESYEGGGIFSWIFDTAGEIFSWTSPFILIKGLIVILTEESQELYTFVNLFLLRPLGWICSYFFIEWAIFTARGRNE